MLQTDTPVARLEAALASLSVQYRSVFEQWIAQWGELTESPEGWRISGELISTGLLDWIKRCYKRRMPLPWKHFRALGYPLAKVADNAGLLVSRTMELSALLLPNEHHSALYSYTSVTLDNKGQPVLNGKELFKVGFSSDMAAALDEPLHFKDATYPYQCQLGETQGWVNAERVATLTEAQAFVRDFQGEEIRILNLVTNEVIPL